MKTIWKYMQLRRRKTEGKRQKAEGRRQKVEGRSPKSEVRSQKTGDGRPRSGIKKQLTRNKASTFAMASADEDEQNAD